MPMKMSPRDKFTSILGEDIDDTTPSQTVQRQNRGRMSKTRDGKDTGGTSAAVAGFVRVPVKTSTTSRVSNDNRD